MYNGGGMGVWREDRGIGVEKNVCKLLMDRNFFHLLLEWEEEGKCSEEEENVELDEDECDG